MKNKKITSSKGSGQKKIAKNAKETDQLEYSVDEILAKVVATPMKPTPLTSDQKIEVITRNFREIMEVLGLDLSDDSLADTPKRVAKMYVNEIFSGLNSQNFPKITVIENKMKYDQMIVVQGIELISCCEHHFQTIDGFATVAYIPNKKVIGLSKINRIVQFFSRRPQVQERLTKQIADCLQHVLETEHVAVHINARHYCVISRGIEDSHSATATADLRGHFKSKHETRKEFLLHCKTK